MAKHGKKHLRSKPINRTEQPVVDEKVRQERVLPIIASLKSADPNERSTSLVALLNIIEDKNIRHMLLRERLIKVILSNILSDSSLEVVSQGFGVLRNVVLLEGRDPAVFLLRENIRIPIEDVSTKALVSMADLPNLNENDRKILSAIIENVCGLTAAIIMSSVETRGWKSVVRLALAVATSVGSHLTTECLDTAFELLYYISEDLENEEIIEILQEEANKDVISQLKTTALQSSLWPRKIYGIGIEFNSLIKSDSDMLEICKDLCNFLQEVPKTDVNSVQVSLDLLAIAAQTEELEQIMLLVSQIGPLLIEFEQSGTDYQRHAISVLNNIGWALNSLEHDWTSDARNMFSAVVSNSFTNFDDAELISSALGLLGATLIQDPELAISPEFKELLKHSLDQVDSLYAQSDIEWIGVARALVVILASHNISAKLDLVDASSRLIFLMLEYGDAAAQIDALNALFDIHGDNEAPYNQAEYNEKQLNERLHNLKPLLKRSLKSIPKTDQALRDEGLHVITTLDNFIAYKKN